MMKPRQLQEWTHPRFHCHGPCLSWPWVSLCLDTKTGFSDFSACPRGSRGALTFQKAPYGQTQQRLRTHVWFRMGWAGRNTMAEKTTKGRRSCTWTINDWKGLSLKAVLIRENASQHRLCMHARLQQAEKHEFLMQRSQMSRCEHLQRCVQVH